LTEYSNDPQPLPEAEAGQRQDNWGSLLRDVLETLFLSVVLFLAINAVSARVRVDGYSMRPTLDDGQFVLVNRLAYRLGDYARGDIIVFSSPVIEGEDLIKRIIGLPGDHVVVENGRLSVNGMALEEEYIAAPPSYVGAWDVPEGYLFVLGDNRNDSSDSHAWGPLEIERVIGRAVLIYWPFPEMEVLEHGGLVLAQSVEASQ